MDLNRTAKVIFSWFWLVLKFVILLVASWVMLRGVVVVWEATRQVRVIIKMKVMSC